MIYNIHYDVCAMVISMFSIVLALLKKGFRQKQTKVLFALFCVTVGAAFFDIISAISNSYTDQWSDIQRNAFNYVYLLLQNVMPYLVCCYVVYVIGLTYRLGTKQITKMFLKLAASLIICILLLITNPFTNFVFYFDADKVYRHGPGMYVLYGIAFVYLLLSVFLLIRYGHRAVKEARIMIFVLEVATILSVLVQMLIPGILIQLFVESLCLLGLLVTVDNEAEIVDSVTTCYNRQRFVTDSILGLENEAEFEVIIIRLPNLGAYTASFGVGEVNKIMHNLGLWLRSVCKESNVYYCGGGSIAIICDKNTAGSSLEPVLTDRFADNFVVEQTAIRFRPIINVIKAGRDFDSLEQLMLWVGEGEEHMDSAYAHEDYNVKIIDYQKELAMQRAIEHALANDEFEVLYQPIWDARNNTISEGEALVRLHDDQGNLIPAEDFIEYAEHRGYIMEIGDIVFEAVCRFITSHDIDKVGINRIHVNLSLYQCMNEMLAEQFEKIRSKYHASAERIVFEISDNNISDNFGIIEKTINSLRDKGYRFVLDNYGNGTMNMNHLFQLPFSAIKFDKSFLWRAQNNVKASIFFSGTMRMAREMNMKTIVLGVEEAADKNLMQNYDCDYMQGFYYQRAVPAEQFYRYCVGFNSKG